MKLQSGIVAGLLVLSLTAASGQDGVPGQRIPAPRPMRLPPGGDPVAAHGGLTKFDLDFPGGKPRELVAAIQKALGQPLNAFVPDEFADVKLPALKMSNVNVAELFRALINASRKTVPYVTSTYFAGGFAQPNYSYQTMITSYGFKTSDDNPTDQSIWYFYEDKPALPPGSQQPQAKVVRFYLLTPYLDHGLTVDDITTAIRTGWQMQGDNEKATISFHKETKLLIAVGDPNKLDTIDAVLRALQPVQPFPMQGRAMRGIGGGGGRSSVPATSSSTDEPKNDQ